MNYIPSTSKMLDRVWPHHLWTEEKEDFPWPAQDIPLTNSQYSADATLDTVSLLRGKVTLLTQVQLVSTGPPTSFTQGCSSGTWHCFSPREGPCTSPCGIPWGSYQPFSPGSFSDSNTLCCSQHCHLLNTHSILWHLPTYKGLHSVPSSRLFIRMYGKQECKHCWLMTYTKISWHPARLCATDHHPSGSSCFTTSYAQCSQGPQEACQQISGTHPFPPGNSSHTCR